MKDSHLVVVDFTWYRQDEETTVSDRVVVQSHSTGAVIMVYGQEHKGQALGLRVLKQAESEGEVGK